ncbi:ABC-F family ATP-binding cassette domain-containing protein [Hirschia maritima]|uniref:ABC-F family ATP-binding cassette domain-containing protein n=1 Tax=Hirschia maritima TaxID=1121961 RepID=UPI000371F12F|nr:ATP-binding cassette domain-containing protein [Hirschia maritima]
MSQAPIATLRDVQLTLGGAPLFTGVDLSLYAGERIALVGRNGAGKSTLMRIFAGALDADSGEVWKQPGTSLQFLNQEPDFSKYKTALDYAAADLEETELYLAETELDIAGLAHDVDPSTLSGGQGKRLALARAFASDPDILLLDEPTNHLDVDAIEELEGRISSFRGAILLVSHDRRFMENTTTATAWLRQGAVRKLDRGYKAFDDWAEKVEAEDEKALDRLQTKLKAEQRWLMRGVTGRRKRNQGRLSKVKDMRKEQAERKHNLNQSNQTASIISNDAAPSSKLVFEGINIQKAFDTPKGKKIIAKDFSIKIMRGARIGLVGGNGVGKSTLLKIMLGEINADEGSGRIRIAKNLQITYLDQNRNTLKDEDTLWETLAPDGGDQIMVRDYPRHVASYAKDFMFGPEQLRQPVSALSGGERNRLTLAIALAKSSNLMVLDEPTNDLDMETLDLLEDMLMDYDGTLIIVSHDRAFLDGVVTSVLTPEGNGEWLETPGGYSDYLIQQKNRASAKKKASETKSATAKSADTSKSKQQTKLTFKDQHRYNELEKLIPSHENTIGELETALADPELFSKKPEEFNSKAKQLDEMREELEAFEMEWLELEEKRENLG